MLLSILRWKNMRLRNLKGLSIRRLRSLWGGMGIGGRKGSGRRRKNRGECKSIAKNDSMHIY